jgi:hypothetical protein
MAFGQQQPASQGWPNVPAPPHVSFTPGNYQFTPPPSLDDATIYLQSVIVSTEQMRSGSAASVAKAEIEHRYFDTNADYLAAVWSAKAQVDQQRYNTDKQFEATRLGLTTVNNNEVALREHEARHRLEAAAIQASAAMETADARGRYDKYVADRQLESTVYQTDRRYDEAIETAKIDRETRRHAAEVQRQTAEYQTDADYAIRFYTTNKQADVSLSDQANAREIERLREAHDRAMLERRLGYADAKFNLIYPIVQQSIAQASAQAGTLATPGLATQTPFVSTAGVWTRAEIQQQVNRAWAKNDGRTQAEILRTQAELAGRGFSSNGPLMEALRVGFVGQNLRANAEAATGIRLQAAQLNAESQRAGQVAAAEVFDRQQQVALASEKNQIDRQVGLVGALAQLIGSVS